MQSHALQVQQFEHDRELLQQAIARLEADLADARRAQDSLDDQKQENVRPRSRSRSLQPRPSLTLSPCALQLLLKETIDKLRFEIEEMRSVGRKSGFLEGGSAGPGGAFASPRKTLDDSINKSLGREIASQMAAQQADESSEEEEEDTAGESDVDDIIVTTHRRIVRPFSLLPSSFLHRCPTDVATVSAEEARQEERHGDRADRHARRDFRQRLRRRHPDRPGLLARDDRAD